VSVFDSASEFLVTSISEPDNASNSVKPLSAVQARKALCEFQHKRDGYAIWLLSFDLLLFGVGQWLAIAMNGGWRALGVVVTWVAIVRLFVIGHDACHQALTSSKRLNDTLGRVAFLVSLTPYSLWRVGHNVVHHGFNNLRGRDFVWEPKTLDEYAAMPKWRQRIERLYRGAAGPAIYYFVDIWWRRLFFPNRNERPVDRREFFVDCWLISAVAVMWLTGLYAYAHAHGQSLALAALLAFVIPFVLWNWTMGLIVYMHHTHPDVRWYDDKREWQHDAAQVSATLHLLMPWPLGPVMHHIMEHPAHHLDGTIPLYNLRDAQYRLQEIGAEFVKQRLTLALYLDCVRQCKLYDYRQRRWVGFPESA
jgi:acyl-lipid omega-6 desaturase (Delta-12 desaturase)